MANQFSMDDFLGDKIVSVGEPHLACALLLDVSGSMYGEAIGSLNAGIRRFRDSLMQDATARKRVDIAIITFSNVAQVISDFGPVSSMPVPALEAGGATNMADAIDLAIDMVKNRTHMYQNLGTPCHKPWIFMITDGISTSNPRDMQRVAERIKMEETKGSHGRLSFWALGVDDYDSAEMFQLTNRVIELRNHDFTGIFDWLSESMTAISQSHVGERPDLNDLPPDARKAMEDRAIDDDWY